jgi:hypothetical protein
MGATGEDSFRWWIHSGGGGFTYGDGGLTYGESGFTAPVGGGLTAPGDGGFTPGGGGFTPNDGGIRGGFVGFIRVLLVNSDKRRDLTDGLRAFGHKKVKGQTLAILKPTTNGTDERNRCEIPR